MALVRAKAEDPNSAAIPYSGANPIPVCPAVDTQVLAVIYMIFARASQRPQRTTSSGPTCATEAIRRAGC